MFPPSVLSVDMAAGNPKWCSASPIRSLLAISSPPQRYTAEYYIEVQISTAIPFKGAAPVFYSKSTDILCKEMQHLLRLRECFPLQMYKVHTNKKTDVQNNDLWLYNREGVQSFTCCGLRLLGLDGR